ncbi:hypothetical protein F543_21570 [Bibersteinia trehalosi USDA-ARS-USMARC-189]|uniref:Type II secretory pathway, pseudopilin n=1 Tax=Bibersteinia trehalosi USDA-ARS-USMARC-189 TaxID=1263831 RepID=A0ABM5PFP6_BIBTR|nr:DUF5374 domain-containing protein [Bibersteinia trehalosi]AGH37515.1 hypothetical protein WQG_2290 [Bibersteinia trehalosi USDA-ARS-USMARC-192]AHG85012.1 hypothetical protein F543_21570 [Bibersteinia trehalosi USDA-ARS-USMARC-189]
MKIIKAESIISLLIAVGLFSIVCLAWLQWQSEQNAQGQLIFQRQQALQIAENQIARQMAGLSCQRKLEQNGIYFEIIRCTTTEIEIHFPKGKIIVNRTTKS